MIKIFAAICVHIPNTETDRDIYVFTLILHRLRFDSNYRKRIYVASGNVILRNDSRSKELPIKHFFQIDHGHPFFLYIPTAICMGKFNKIRTNSIENSIGKNKYYIASSIRGKS